MTLIIQKPTGGKLVLRKELPADAEADAYIAAVEAADGQALESGVKFAIKNFVLCCKADGIWTAIKASCILAGARTLNGALVPLVGTAPTNNNFASGDYNRKTGLIGNGTTKYLNSNFQYSSLALSKDSHHLSYWRPTGDAGTCAIAAKLDGSNNDLILNNSAARSFHADASALTAPDTSPQTGFRGMNRSSSASYSYRGGGLVSTLSITSVSTGTSRPLFIFARNNGGTPDAFTTGRKAFYSIGESLDLAKLDARVTDLINAIGAAIP
jgi:hypothetical protein